jgi:hypothetical protein
MAKRLNRITPISTAVQQSYSDHAGVFKVSEAGLYLKPIGALNAAVLVGQSANIAIFNSDSAVQYVAFGAAAMGAPSSAANGIPVPAGSWLRLSSGPNDYVRSSSANVFGYAIEDSSKE